MIARDGAENVILTGDFNAVDGQVPLRISMAGDQLPVENIKVSYSNIDHTPSAWSVPKDKARRAFLDALKDYGDTLVQQITSSG